jgi:hypothetical protein
MPRKPHIIPRCRCGWTGTVFFDIGNRSTREIAQAEQAVHIRKCSEAVFSTPYAMIDLIISVAKDEMQNGVLKGDGTRSRLRYDY